MREKRSNSGPSPGPGLNMDGNDSLIVGTSQFGLSGGGGGGAAAASASVGAIAIHKRSTGKVHRHLPSKTRIDRHNQVSSMVILPSNTSTSNNTNTTNNTNNNASNILTNATEIEFDDEA